MHAHRGQQPSHATAPDQDAESCDGGLTDEEENSFQGR